jgi:hypothetical protein
VTSSGLKVHIACSHAEQKTNCKYCGKEFKSQMYATRHEKRVHGKICYPELFVLNFD